MRKICISYCDPVHLEFWDAEGSSGEWSRVSDEEYRLLTLLREAGQILEHRLTIIEKAKESK